MSETPLPLFLGWSPPEPLLTTLGWPVPTAGQAVVVALDFYAVVGGPFRGAVNRWLANGWPILWQITARAEESDRLMLSVSQAVEEIQSVATFADELEIETISRKNEWPLWARALFPKLFREIGEEEFSNLILNFHVESPMVSETPWLELAYLPGFIRSLAREYGHLAELAALEWAGFQALYSPMDEVAEMLSLEPSELMVNPAAQIVPLELRGEVVSLVRRKLPGWTIEERVLDWMQAALIDELSESPRIARSQLLATVEFEMDSVVPPAPVTGTWGEKLNELVAAEIILVSRVRGSPES